MDNETNSKYRDIYTTGKELFWKHGIKRVTIEEICREAKVSKMTFYKFFPNKIDLAKTLLQQIMDESMADFKTIVNNQDPFAKKLEAMFMMKQQAVSKFSMEFINDIYASPELGLKVHLDEMVEKVQESIKDFYRSAQKQGFIRPNVNVDFIIAISLQLPKLMENKELMSQYKQPLDFIMEVMNMMFYGIVTRNE